MKKNSFFIDHAFYEVLKDPSQIGKSENPRKEFIVGERVRFHGPIESEDGRNYIFNFEPERRELDGIFLSIMVPKKKEQPNWKDYFKLIGGEIKTSHEFQKDAIYVVLKDLRDWGLDGEIPEFRIGQKVLFKRYDYLAYDGIVGLTFVLLDSSEPDQELVVAFRRTRKEPIWDEYFKKVEGSKQSR